MNLLKALLGTTCAVSALAAMPARAQTQAQDAGAAIGDPVASAKLAADRGRADDGSARADSSQEIVVTGTRIVRPNTKSAAPITTVTTVDIAAQGATTIEEVLNRLP